MARRLKLQNLKYEAVTHEGASAYDYSTSHAHIHLVFTMGSALFTDGFYETEQKQIRRYSKALFASAAQELKFAWQYAAWMRDPKRGKGNRIQGSLAPALLDSFVETSSLNEEYVAKSLSHRPDDVTAFLRHFQRLGLGTPTANARRGMARALASFDEYQLQKYAEQKAADVRLCDAILFVAKELEVLGADGALALDVGRYLHASSRDRVARATVLPLTSARRELWTQPKSFAENARFAGSVGEARVTWEQVLSKFGSCYPVWEALLRTRGLLGDMAFMRNLRNMHEAGFDIRTLRELAGKRAFAEVWPHQVYAGFKAVPQLREVFDIVFSTAIEKLPSGRHLGIGDASGSMGVRVGGEHGSLSCMDVAMCFVALMSETSGLGASFCDETWLSYSTSYLSIAQRSPNASALQFAGHKALKSGMGGTQVFGAVMELCAWLKQNDHVKPPDCLWFFSDMQFHPAASAKASVPLPLQEDAKRLGLGTNVPPLELALRLYRKLFSRVDVVLWNLAAYAPVPVAADMEGVLLVSGFDTNTFSQVETWRRSGRVGEGRVAQNQGAVLDAIRQF